MHSLQIPGIVACLLFSIGCSTEGSHTPAATPRPTPAIVASTIAAGRATTPQVNADTARRASVDIVPQAVLDTALCAVADTTPKDAGTKFIDSAESAALPGANGKAARVCGELRIRLLNGRTAVFRDDTTMSPTFGLARYDGYLKTIHAHVVHHYNMEGSGAFIIVDDSTGESRIVFGKPVASPDGTRFVLTSMADEAGYDPGMIEIWRMVDRRPEKEFSFDTGESRWQASDPVWVDSATIDFTMNTYTSMSEPDIESPGRMIRSGTQWEIVPGPPVTANPVGVWRGTSLCTDRSSSCNDEATVYRITRAGAGDSLSVDGRKIVNGREEEMGLIRCGMFSVTQLKCATPKGIWYFTVRQDSLVGVMILPDHSPSRRVRAARSR